MNVVKGIADMISGLLKAITADGVFFILLIILLGLCALPVVMYFRSSLAKFNSTVSKAKLICLADATGKSAHKLMDSLPSAMAEQYRFANVSRRYKEFMNIDTFVLAPYYKSTLSYLSRFIAGVTVFVTVVMAVTVGIVSAQLDTVVFSDTMLASGGLLFLIGMLLAGGGKVFEEIILKKSFANLDTLTAILAGKYVPKVKVNQAKQVKAEKAKKAVTVAPPPKAKTATKDSINRTIIEEDSEPDQPRKDLFSEPTKITVELAEETRDLDEERNSNDKSTNEHIKTIDGEQAILFLDDDEVADIAEQVSGEPQEKAYKTKTIDQDIDELMTPRTGDSPYENVTAPRTGDRPYENVTAPRTGDRPFENVTAPRTGDSPYENVTAPRTGDRPFENVTTPRTNDRPYENVTAPRTGDRPFEDMTAPRTGDRPYENVTAPRTGDRPFENVTAPRTGDRPFEDMTTPRTNDRPFENVTTPRTGDRPFEDVVTPRTNDRPYEEVITPKTSDRVEVEPLRAASPNPPPIFSSQTAAVDEQDPAMIRSRAETEDVIARIELINREGAPLTTMKEVATLLQHERAKVENKSPDRQRRLNEVLSSLLRAMTSVRKN